MDSYSGDDFVPESPNLKSPQFRNGSGKHVMQSKPMEVVEEDYSFYDHDDSPPESPDRNASSKQDLSACSSSLKKQLNVNLQSRRTTSKQEKPQGKVEALHIQQQSSQIVKSDQGRFPVD